MKMTLTICLLLLAETIFSQDRLADFPADPATKPGPITDPATLSRLLTTSCTTEKEKVKAIFRWITENISYYPLASKKNKKGKQFLPLIEEEAPDTTPLKPLTERIAIRVLQDRKTRCEGYARLFKCLCDHAGIPAEIVTGYARTDVNRIGDRFRSNHSWNAVYIDSAWHLLDVTFASGYTARSSGEFIRYYDESYFLTAPEQFIEHHYPDDLRWTLLPHPPPLYEFRYTPFRQRSYGKYDFTGYYPSRGIINAQVGDTIHLELETPVAFRSLSVAPDSLWDSSTLLITPLYTYIKPAAFMPGKAIYSFRVDSEAVEWLHVMYNDDAVLRYKLNVRKPKEKN